MPWMVTRNVLQLPLFARILIVVTACPLLAACGRGGGAGDVVEKYVTALSNGDAQTALTCVAPERRSQAEPIVKLGATVASTLIEAEGGLDSVTIVRTEVRGDRAEVSYRTKTKKGMERRDSASAERIHGVWYIAQ